MDPTNELAIAIAISRRQDGSMSKAVEKYERDRNRRNFLSQNGISPEQTVLVHLTYESGDYLRYATIGKSKRGDGITRQSSMEVDALFTRHPGIALFLPVADCVAAVLYDPVQNVLGMSHLGRHNLVQHGGTVSVDYMTEMFGTDPRHVKVWIGPAVDKQAYPLFDFARRSLHDVAIQQLRKAGVLEGNIVVDRRDTATDQSLFSHSEYLKGRQETDGRQAVVAMMRL